MTRSVEQQFAASPTSGGADAAAWERKRQVLTHGAPSTTASIADALVIKDGAVFLLSGPDGIVPDPGEHGLGLYYNDCRYLNGYVLDLAGCHPDALAATTDLGCFAALQLSNPHLELEDGRCIPEQTVTIRWERLIDSDSLLLAERITFRNFGSETVTLPVGVRFSAAFEDLFVVRGMLDGTSRGEGDPPRWYDDALHFERRGVDGLYRRVTVHLWPSPSSREESGAQWLLELAPRERIELHLAVVLGEDEQAAEEPPMMRERPEIGELSRRLRERTDPWPSQHTRFQSNSRLLNMLVRRSLRDLQMLRTPLHDVEYVAAGVPWFVAFFGRDAAITAWQLLAVDPALAEQTLRLLARYQGDAVDEWRDAAPGKMPHELRIGELTRAGELPYTPYYGTVDATLLFLILLCEHAEWTGSLALFDELRDNVEAALTWMTSHGDPDGNGYIEYESTSGDAKHGFINQGWKDSGNAIVTEDGALATPPIALVEVQAYAYRARLGVASLLRRRGEPERAAQLEQDAAELRERFQRDFWMADERTYAMALHGAPRDGRKRRAAVVSSNAGHALWAGIADQARARQTSERLLAEDMFSGWGIRTLSSDAVRYNPLGYHLGTVWPHDNAMIVAGFRRYGLDAAAHRVADAVMEASTHFAEHRLPELFSGLARGALGRPVPYPVANHPQAWGAGSIPSLLTSMLGLAPAGFERQLRLLRPRLPAFVDRLELRELMVAGAHVDVSFRCRNDVVEVRVLDGDEELDVVVEGAERVR